MIITKNLFNKEINKIIVNFYDFCQVLFRICMFTILIVLGLKNYLIFSNRGEVGKFSHHLESESPGLDFTSGE